MYHQLLPPNPFNYFRGRMLKLSTPIYLFMRKITLSLPDNIEEELRRMAKTRYKGMKGALSIIMVDALELYFLEMKKKSEK